MYYSQQPIELSRAIQIAPSIAAVSEHHSRSDRYAFVPTTKVLEGLIGEGFAIYGVTQANCRTLDKVNFTKHLIRMRKPGSFDNHREAPEIVLINSHDGSSRYILMAGMIKFACANGLILGDMWDDVRIKHSGDIVDNVIEGTYSVVDQFDEITENVAEMQQLRLTGPEAEAFARSAIPLRFDVEKVEDAPVTVEQVLRPRRATDSENNLWNVFNRTQENLIRGGIRGISERNGRLQRRRTREVKAIDQNVKLNKALWTLAEEMAKLKKN